MLHNNEIGFNIKQRREQLRISEKAMAQAVGIKRPLYTSFEEGKRAISLDYLNRIADILDCSPAEFLKDDIEELITTESILQTLPQDLTDAEMEVILQAKAILQQKYRENQYI